MEFSFSAAGEIFSRKLKVQLSKTVASQCYMAPNSCSKTILKIEAIEIRSIVTWPRKTLTNVRYLKCEQEGQKLNSNTVSFLKTCMYVYIHTVASYSKL